MENNTQDVAYSTQDPEGGSLIGQITHTHTPRAPPRDTHIHIFKRDLGPPYAWHLWVYDTYGLGARELLQRPPEAPATQNSTGPGMWALGGGF